MLKIDIISGFLGAGKTTFIKRLLNTNIKNEKVVLIENEFGEVSVDSDLLSDSKIDIAELSQGCICCSLVGDFAKSLNDVISKYNPDRILIEPSGVGKLSDVKKAIVDANLGEYLNSFICLVDAAKAKVYHKNFGEFFSDQIASASTVILSRTDIVDETKINNAVAIIRELNKNCLIISTPIKELEDEDLIDAYEGISDDFMALLLEEVKQDQKDHHHEECGCEHHDHHHKDCGCEHHEHHHEECCCEHHDHHHEECGCEHHDHHHADEVFQSIGIESSKTYEYKKLENTLHNLAYSDDYGTILRAKGIVRTDKGWTAFNLTPEEVLLEPSNALPIGKICVIGSNIDSERIKSLF